MHEPESSEKPLRIVVVAYMRPIQSSDTGRPQSSSAERANTATFSGQRIATLIRSTAAIVRARPVPNGRYRHD